MVLWFLHGNLLLLTVLFPFILWWYPPFMVSCFFTMFYSSLIGLVVPLSIIVASAIHNVVVFLHHALFLSVAFNLNHAVCLALLINDYLLSFLFGSPAFFHPLLSTRRKALLSSLYSCRCRTYTDQLQMFCFFPLQYTSFVTFSASFDWFYSFFLVRDAVRCRPCLLHAAHDVRASSNYVHSTAPVHDDSAFSSCGFQCPSTLPHRRCPA